MRAILTLACLLWLFALPAQARATPSSRMQPTRVPSSSLHASTLQATRAQHRHMQVRIASVDTAAVRMQGVRVRLSWAEGAPQGDLVMHVARLDAPDLGYRFRDVAWRCPLQRDGQGGWRCHGGLSAPGAHGLRLALDLGAATTTLALQQPGARFALGRSAAAPDLTTFDLTRVPAAWAQALLSQAWPAARFKAGTLSGRLQLDTGAARPLRVSGPLSFEGLALETGDASIAAEGLRGRFAVDYRKAPGRTQAGIDGALRGGELLAGSTYVSLPSTPVALRVDAVRSGGQGWRLPRIEWRDGSALAATGAAALSPDGAVRSLHLDVRSDDLSPVRARYLSGQLALLGLGDVALQGGAQLQLRVDDGALSLLDVALRDAGLQDPARRFGFDGLRGHVRHVGSGSADSALAWRGGVLYGLAFGAAQLPLRSTGGTLAFREPVAIPLMGGTLRLDDVRLRPPAGDTGLDLRFGLALDGIDVARVSKALGLPAFQGTLSGRIPRAHYADERLQFDGGLSMQLFDGRVDFSALSLERPFGSAPSLSADIALDDLDLLRLTEVLDIGRITGRLDGSVRGLRLVDWTPVAFDAALHTDAQAARRAGVRQRISQRAVQDISSVGDASFVSSLQGQLIGLFDDFGYARIAIGCRLANEVCRMSGIDAARDARTAARDGSGQGGFTIVAGAGLPRLDVVGYNRQVDWPTLVDRIAAAGKGDVKPVVE